MWERGETAYAADLKSATFGFVGSNPTAPTITVMRRAEGLKGP